MKFSNRVLLVAPVISLSLTDSQPRIHREIDLMLETGNFQPYIVTTEPLLLSKPLQYLHNKSLDYTRVQVFRVPNIVIGPLTANRKMRKISKFMFGLCNVVFQTLYITQLTMLLFCIVVAMRVKIIHAHNPPDLTGLAAFFVSKITGVPYVFEIHDRAPELECFEMGIPESSIVYKLLKSVERIAVSNSAGLITVNELVADYYKQYGGPNPISIPTGTTLDLIESNEKTLHDNRKIDKHVILYQGVLNLSIDGEPTGYDLALPLDAMPMIMQNVPDTTLVYVGDGPGRAILQKKAKMLGLQDKVVFTGFISRKQVFEWMKTADVLLIPYANTKNNSTTVPTKLYEYMAVGKPIVATRFPGIERIISNEHNGLLYGVTSLEDFSLSVIRILNDPQLAEKLGSNAKQDLRVKYSFEKNWPKLISLYYSITSKV